MRFFGPACVGLSIAALTVGFTPDSPAQVATSAQLTLANQRTCPTSRSGNGASVSNKKPAGRAVRERTRRPSLMPWLLVGSSAQ